VELGQAAKVGRLTAAARCDFGPSALRKNQKRIIAMQSINCHVVIFVAVFFVEMSTGAPALTQKAMPSPMFDRFSQSIIESEDTDKLKERLYETVVFELARHDDNAALSVLAKRGDQLSFRDSEDNTLLHVTDSQKILRANLVRSAWLTSRFEEKIEFLDSTC
jgi:hypothetical protein